MKQKGWTVAAASASSLALAALRRFPPDRYPVYPACPFHAATGLLCPGCGTTRALAALVQGHLHQALHANALFVALLPFAVAYGWAAMRSRWRGHPWPRIPAAAPSVLAAAALLFTLWRNLAVR